MIHLIRVYKDNRVVFAQAIDKDDIIARHRLHSQQTGCRCAPVESWPQRIESLAHEHGLGRSTSNYTSTYTYQHGKVTVEPIYPTPQKRTK